MTLLLLLSAMLSALTGVGGSVRVVEAPALTAQTAALIVTEADHQGKPSRAVAVAPPEAPRGVVGRGFALSAPWSTYLDRRRE